MLRDTKDSCINIQTVKIAVKLRYVSCFQNIACNSLFLSCINLKNHLERNARYCKSGQDEVQM